MGGDAVKVLAWYRPMGVRPRGNRTSYKGSARPALDIPYLFELWLSAGRGRAGAARLGDAGEGTDHVLASVEEFAKPEYGIDAKLESPIGANDVPVLA